MSEAEPIAERKVNAPYTSFATFKNFLAGLRASGGAPIVIDNSVYGNMSGGVRSQLKATLRFLGLIDDANKPTDLMHAAIEATQDAAVWGAFVSNVLSDHYAPILAHPLTNSTPAALRKEFEATFSGSPDVMTKSITFFIHAARDAGVALSPRLTERQRGGGARRGAGGRRRDAAATAQTGGQPPPAQPNPVKQNNSADTSVSPESLTRLLKQIENPPEDVQKAIITIILYLTVGNTKALGSSAGAGGGSV
jgi:hypothetical protein